MITRNFHRTQPSSAAAKPAPTSSARKSNRDRPRSRAREYGAVAVEFALILPVFLTLVFGVIEFGVLLTNKISLTNAARVGARYASLSAANTTSSQTKATNAASGLSSCASLSAVTTYAGTPNEASVTVSCTYTPITPLGALINSVIPTALSSTTRMVVES